ncbi:hypothetical protein FOZ62_018140, partial [Perkinsus olseni]
KEVADYEATNEALQRKINILKSQLKSQRTNAAKGGSGAGAAGAQEAAETESVSAVDGEEMDPVERLMQAEDRIAELQLMVNRLEQEKFLAEGDAEAQMMLMNGAAAVGSQ